MLLTSIKSCSVYFVKGILPTLNDSNHSEKLTPLEKGAERTAASTLPVSEKSTGFDSVVLLTLLLHAAKITARIKINLNFINTSPSLFYHKSHGTQRYNEHKEGAGIFKKLLFTIDCKIIQILL